MPDEIGSCISQVGNCPVCGDVIVDRKKKCSQCGTPHHEECLEYNGKCGMYACNGMQKPPAPKKMVKQAKSEVSRNSFYDVHQWLPHIPNK
jgi:hypothetical protein